MFYLLALMNTPVVTVNFDVIEYTTTEDDTDLEVCVNIIGGSLERHIALLLSSMDGTAQGILLHLLDSLSKTAARQ